jgi:hypothetical protein
MIMIQAFISTHPQISWYQLQPVYLAKCICPQTIFSTLQQVPPHKYFYHPPPSPRPPSPVSPSPVSPSTVSPSTVPRLPSPRPPSPVPRLPSPVSRLPSPVPRPPSPVPRPPSPVHRLPSTVPRPSSQSWAGISRGRPPARSDFA